MPRWAAAGCGLAWLIAVWDTSSKGPSQSAGSARSRLAKASGEPYESPRHLRWAAGGRRLQCPAIATPATQSSAVVATGQAQNPSRHNMT